MDKDRFSSYRVTAGTSTRRDFMRAVTVLGGSGLLAGCATTGRRQTTEVSAQPKPEDRPDIQGFENTLNNVDPSKPWQPVSDRKIRVGIAGYGVCKFGAAFGFQDHPNVTVVAVTDLIPERCSELAKRCRCERTYPSLEEMVKDPEIEAVFLATDAPSHCNHAILSLKHGKHVACAVPAVFGSLEDADRLYQAVKDSGLTYMMFETSAYTNECYAMRQLYRAGALGTLVYSEGEYYHFMEEPIDSFRGWRIGLPPQYYPTHSTAFHIAVCGGAFTEVTCYGFKSQTYWLQPENNVYKNPFGTEIALLRTTDGGMSRMAVSWDTPGHGGEIGRVRGTRGSVKGTTYHGLDNVQQVQIQKPALPPGVEAGGHGGSHGYLCEEFIHALLTGRRPLVDISAALNMTVPGILAHHSALRDGETLKVPVYQPV